MACCRSSTFGHRRRERFSWGAGRLDPLPRDDMMTDLIACMRDRSRTPNCSALLGYKVMVAIKLGVDAYRQSATLRFDPDKEVVLKA